MIKKSINVRYKGGGGFILSGSVQFTLHISPICCNIHSSSDGMLEYRQGFLAVVPNFVVKAIRYCQVSLQTCIMKFKYTNVSQFYHGMQFDKTVR